jgi:alcohol dehydrogenase (cytochrome c)
MLRRSFVVMIVLTLSVPFATQSAPLRVGHATSAVRAASASVGWPSYNNDLASDRYVNLNTINTTNVKQLAITCSVALGGAANFQTGPIVVGSTLYATRANQTVAINATNCAPVWTNTFGTSTSTNRGIAAANGLLFRGFSDGHVVALNAATGAIVWSQSVIAAGSYESIPGAPIVANGIVFVGTSNAERAQTCRVVALSAATGKILWSQQTVPNAGGSGSGTWVGAPFIAGGSMWTSLSFDSATGRLYVPIGNPEADFDIRQRGGTNSPTASIVELNASTGTPERGIQLVPQDFHDWDIAAAPALITLANGNKTLLVAGKDGYLRNVAVSTFTQQWKTAVTTISNATAPIVKGGTHYCPLGAVLWNGPAYSPATGFAYVNASDWCTTIDLAATPEPYVPGKQWLGTGNGFGTADSTNSGWLNAVNATTGAIVWRYHAAAPLVAGVTPTAGGVVFTADLQGHVLAFDAVKGTLLTSIALPEAAGATGPPAVGGGVISYEIAGQQYVAVAAGMTSPTFKTPQANSTIVILSLPKTSLSGHAR